MLSHRTYRLSCRAMLDTVHQETTFGYAMRTTAHRLPYKMISYLLPFLILFFFRLLLRPQRAVSFFVLATSSIYRMVCLMLTYTLQDKVNSKKCS